MARGRDLFFSYQADLPKEPEFITDTLSYASGDMIARYGGGRSIVWGPELNFPNPFPPNSAMTKQGSTFTC